MRLNFIFALLVVFLWACSSDEHEVLEYAGHSWVFEGVLDDSTAAVKVSHWTSKDSGGVRETSWEKHYAVRMNSYWISSDDSKLESFLKTVGEKAEIPSWCEGCYAAGKIDKKTYGIKSSPLDDFSDACALILVDEKKNLDSLELEKCWTINMKTSLSLQVRYLNVDGDLYEVRNGAFPSQRPVYRIKNEGDRLKFTDSKGDYIIYGGAP